MLFWCFILTLLGLANLYIALWDFDAIPRANEIMAVAILLVAAGILYQVYFKSRRAEREKLSQRVKELEDRVIK